MTLKILFIYNLVNIDAFIKFGQIIQCVLKILSGNEVLVSIKGHNSGTTMQKMTCNNPSLNLVNMNAYKHFCENLSIYSQDIEGKRYFGINQGP